jgi:hypothetical protein
VFRHLPRPSPFSTLAHEAPRPSPERHRAPSPKVLAEGSRPSSERRCTPSLNILDEAPASHPDRRTPSPERRRSRILRGHHRTTSRPSTSLTKSRGLQESADAHKAPSRPEELSCPKPQRPSRSVVASRGPKGHDAPSPSSFPPKISEAIIPSAASRAELRPAAPQAALCCTPSCPPRN